MRKVPCFFVKVWEYMHIVIRVAMFYMQPLLGNKFDFQLASDRLRIAFEGGERRRMFACRLQT
jgi:hypothetical protein